MTKIAKTFEKELENALWWHEFKKLNTPNFLKPTPDDTSNGNLPDKPKNKPFYSLKAKPFRQEEHHTISKSPILDVKGNPFEINVKHIVSYSAQTTSTHLDRKLNPDEAFSEEQMSQKLRKEYLATAIVFFRDSHDGVYQSYKKLRLPLNNNHGHIKELLDHLNKDIVQNLDTWERALENRTCGDNLGLPIIFDSADKESLNNLFAVVTKCQSHHVADLICEALNRRNFLFYIKDYLSHISRFYQYLLGRKDSNTLFYVK